MNSVRAIVVAILSSVVLLGTSPLAFAEGEPRKVLTLEECIRSALAHNIALKRTENGLEVGQSRVGLAKADLFPKIDMNAMYFRTASSLGENDDFSASIDASHTLFDFGARRSNIRIAQNRLNVMTYEYAAERQGIVSEVRQAFYSILGNQADLEILAGRKRFLKTELATIRERIAAGLGIEKDRIAAEARLIRADRAFEERKQEASIITVRLTNLTGIENIDSYEIEGPEEIGFHIGPEMSIEDAVALAYENRPELKASAARESVAAEVLAREKRSVFPSVSLALSYTFAGARFLFEKGLTLSGLFNLPLFSGFSSRHRVKQAEAEFEMIRRETELSRQGVRIEVEAALGRLQNSGRTVGTIDKELEEALWIARAAAEKHDAGLGTELELMEARLRYEEASDERRKAHVELLKAEDEFERSTGLVSVDHFIR